jgi:glycosyltransferase involved in cell wall biosynthesis
MVNNMNEELNLSALVITYNEEKNIYRTLNSIHWIPEVLLLDSGSSDRTIEIALNFPNVRLVHRKFDTFANQCNFGLRCLTTEWVLSIDADYVLSEEVSGEIQKLLTSEGRRTVRHQAFAVGFHFCVRGKPIRSGLLPPRTCLYKREFASYVDEGHGHRVYVDGSTGQLRHKIYHDDRKSMETWLKTQKKYQAIEALMLKEKPSKGLPVQDLIRKHTFLAPFAAFFMCLFLRGGILDGKEGVIYAFQRLVAESLLYLSMNLEANRVQSEDGQLHIHHLG